MKPRRSHASPLVSLVLQEQSAARRELQRRRIPDHEQPDLVQETLFLVLRRVRRGGMFLVDEDEHEQRKMLRSYLRRVAEHLAHRWHVRAMLAREAAEVARAMMPAFTDPTERYDARSDVRALDVPESLVPLLVALVELGSISAAALAVGMRSTTAHTRMRNLRRDLRAARRRRKGSRHRE